MNVNVSEESGWMGNGRRNATSRMVHYASVRGGGYEMVVVT